MENEQTVKIKNSTEGKYCNKGYSKMQLNIRLYGL